VSKVIAQQLERVVPQIVHTWETGIKAVAHTERYRIFDRINKRFTNSNRFTIVQKQKRQPTIFFDHVVADESLKNQFFLLLPVIVFSAL